MDTEDLLNDFSWDSTEDIINENVVTEEESTEEPQENPTEDEKKKRFESEEWDDKSPKNEDEDGSEDEEEPSTSIYDDHVRDLMDKGLFRNVEIGEDEVIDEDRFYELQEQEIETEVSNRLQAWAEDELDADARAFIKFKREGGSTSDFFKVYSQNTDTFLDGDIEDPKFQEKVIRKQLESEEWDEEEIEDRLESLSDNGRMKKVAERYFNKMQEEAEEDKKNLLKEAEQRKELALKNEEAFKSSIKETLETQEELNGFTLNDKDKKDLFNFLTRKEKSSGEKPVTGFQRKMAEVFQDRNKLVLLSKILYNDFDFSALEKKTTTKKVKEIKSRLEQRKGPRSFNSGSSLKGKSLADLFD